MSLWPRSDVMCVVVPVESGGCGTPGGHSRPVIKGAPVKVWKLDCPDHCEPYLRGDRKPRVLKYHIDPATKQAIRQERVADSDPMYGTTPDSIPLTPDEERTNATRQDRGKLQIEMIQALAAMRATGIQVPPEAMWLLEREIPEGVLKGTVVCANGHDNPAGAKFCMECRVSMATRGAIAPPEDEPAAVDLTRLHPQTLRKMCREHKPPLPDKGSKDDLIGRLQAAA